MVLLRPVYGGVGSAVSDQITALMRVQGARVVVLHFATHFVNGSVVLGVNPDFVLTIRQFGMRCPSSLGTFFSNRCSLAANLNERSAVAGDTLVYGRGSLAVLSSFKAQQTSYVPRIFAAHLVTGKRLPEILPGTLMAFLQCGTSALMCNTVGVRQYKPFVVVAYFGHCVWLSALVYPRLSVATPSYCLCQANAAAAGIDRIHPQVAWSYQASPELPATTTVQVSRGALMVVRSCHDASARLYVAVIC